MIDTQSLGTDTNVKEMTPTVKQAASAQPDSLAEGFLRFLVVVTGVILGAIAALFLGLVTGWISIAC